MLPWGRSGGFSSFPPSRAQDDRGSQFQDHVCHTATVADPDEIERRFDDCLAGMTGDCDPVRFGCGDWPETTYGKPNLAQVVQNAFQVIDTAGIPLEERENEFAGIIARERLDTIQEMTVMRHSVMTLGRVTFVAATLLLAAMVCLNRRTFQIPYHRWQMQRNQERVFGGPKSVPDGIVIIDVPEDALDQYEYHRQRLVELGAVAERRYRLRYIRARTDEGAHFARVLLSDKSPPHIDFASPYPDEPEPMLLTVWCHPRDVAMWDTFIEIHDVVDYHARFMEHSGED